ncbi:MAG: MFS transporter [Planctomycetes bacterium]|nr:MFS transporter [Planctomycetota bacterium]
MPAWKRTYFVVFISNLVTAVAMMSFLPFFPSFLEELGLANREAVEWWSGLCFGAAPFAAAVMGPIWGSLSDRLGHKLMIVRALFAITIFVGAMAFVTTPMQLFVMRLCQGVFSGFIPPSITLVSVSVPRARQGRVAGNLQAALAAGSVFGPLLGAALGPAYGMRVVFVVVAASAAVSAFLVMFFATEDASLLSSYERWSPGIVLRGVYGDFVRILRMPVLGRALLVLVAVQFGLGATTPQMELFVRDVTGSDDPEAAKAMAASLFTVLSIATLVATPLWGQLTDRVGAWRVLWSSAVVSGLILGLHAAVPAFALLVVARVFLGGAAAGSNTAGFGLAATETQPENRGAAMAVTFSAKALAVSLGAMVGGALCSWIGLALVFVITGTLTSVIALVVVLLARRAMPPSSSAQ